MSADYKWKMNFSASTVSNTCLDRLNVKRWTFFTTLQLVMETRFQMIVTEPLTLEQAEFDLLKILQTELITLQ